MDSPLPPPPTTTTASTAATGGAKTLADLDEDAVAHCAGFLGLRDLASLAMTCRGLRRASYSDLIWSPVYRERWPEQFFSSGLSQVSGIREKYLARRIELQQFKFLDPSIIQLKSHTIPPSHILLDKNCIIVAQGSILQAMKTYTSSDDFPLVEMPREHNARITCARLFPLRDTFLFRSEAQIQDNVLVTSSCDHTIRLWWKGCSQRCFRGHNGPVTTLADKLLGDANAKFLASGGEDGTVRLWSFCTSVKRHALRATFYGHQKPITALSVAGHKPSLLVSISKDAKVRVWDGNASSSSRSSLCVGMTCVPGAPFGLKCHETLCYVASRCEVTAIDLRTMRKVCKVAVHPPKISSFEILSLKSLICTGGTDKAMLWDIRKNQHVGEEKPVVVLDGHEGQVSLIHMDPYKVVTGGPRDSHIRVWETDTGALSNSMSCCIPENEDAPFGCSAMAVDGFRMVTGACGAEEGLLCFRDYTDCSTPISSSPSSVSSSKFWETAKFG